MATVTAEQAMKVAIGHAHLRLNNGDVVREVLEHLWRTAYAAGVLTGQKAVRPAAGGPVAEAAPRAVRQAEAVSQGWRWLPDAVVDLAGQRFTYGGCDPKEPACEREAVLIGHNARGRAMMQLTDTGERVAVPVMLWARIPESGNGSGDTGTAGQ